LPPSIEEPVQVNASITPTHRPAQTFSLSPAIEPTIAALQLGSMKFPLSVSLAILFCTIAERAIAQMGKILMTRSSLNIMPDVFDFTHRLVLHSADP
jgi:hypothetical protein